MELFVDKRAREILDKLTEKLGYTVRDEFEVDADSGKVTKLIKLGRWFKTSMFQSSLFGYDWASNTDDLPTISEKVDALLDYLGLEISVVKGKEDKIVVKKKIKEHRERKVRRKKSKRG